MKKALAILFSVLLLFTALPLGAVAVSAAETYGKFTYTVNWNTVTITSCDTSASGWVYIPSTIAGKPVTKIDTVAFYGCRSITGIHIPDSVVSIEVFSFSSCYSLEEIEVDSNNTRFSSVGGVLFDKERTTILKCPVTKAGKYSIPYGVTVIGESAFSGCDELTSITLPNSVTTIEETAFWGCTALTSITLPSGVKTIGSRAFGACSALTTIAVAAGNPNFSAVDGVLFSKDKTTLVMCLDSKSGDYVIPNGVTAINANAFNNCDRLTSVTIPDSVTTIGYQAFYYCEKLASITIGSGVTTIASDAFAGCTALKAVDIADVAAWCAVSFKDYDSTPFYGANLYVNGTLTTHLVIPDGVTAINDYAFYNCASVTELTLPYSVTSIGNSALPGYSQITDVYYGGTLQDRAAMSISYSIENAQWHYHKHTYDNGCDEECNGCGRVRKQAHVYDNPCDDRCNDCGYRREDFHVYDHVCDAECNECGAYRQVDGHFYVDEMDYTCDKCGTLRDVYVSGTTGACTWTYNYATKTLVISGNGSMGSYSYGNRPPWQGFKKVAVIIEEGVTSIGSLCFAQDYGTIGLISIPSTLISVGSESCMCGAGTVIVNSPTVAAKAEYYDNVGYLFFHNQTTLVNSSIDTIGSYIPYYDKEYEGLFTVNGTEYKVYSSCNHSFAKVTTDTFDGVYCTRCRMPREVYDDAGNFRYIQDGDTITITGLYDENVSEITIPETIGGYPVTAIGANAFKECFQLTSVIIPNSVTTIGSSAFYGCYSLDSITIPNSVTAIGSSAFYNTAYYGDESNWENDVLYLGNYLITAKTTLSGAYAIREGTVTVADYAFDSCASLTAITIPNSVVTIGGNAFYNCDSLLSVTIPDSVITVGNNAFYDCDGLTSVTIGNGVTSIGGSVFYDCDGLTSVVIGNGVASIGGSAFYDCIKLTSITIGNSVTSIGGNAFYNCDSLLSVTIPDSVIAIENNAFYDCDSLTSVVIGNGVTSIGASAFRDCGKLTSVTIGSNVDSIGKNAFDYCYSLNDVYITDMAAWCAIDFANYYANPLYYADHLYWNDTLVTDLVIPDGVTAIGNYAFYYYSDLTSVVIPNSVTTIGEYAFYYCSGLTSVVIPDSVTTIGDDAFYYYSSKLKDVYYGGSEEDRTGISIGSSNSPLTKATWHYDVQIVGEHVYLLACDDVCAVCGAVREADELHVYDNACDVDCNACGLTRDVPDHVYDDEYDADCNVCGEIREVPEKPILYGDANGDGAVNARDAALLQRYIAGWDVTLYEASADTNGDGSVNARDVALLQQYVAGWDIT